MFADGTKIYKEIKSREDCASLQEDLNSLSAWSADTGLSFSVTKYNVQTITKETTSNLRKLPDYWLRH